MANKGRVRIPQACHKAEKDLERTLVMGWAQQKMAFSLHSRLRVTQPGRS